MDKSEAKLILANHTMGPEPLDDPQFVEAKRFAQDDPVLMEWWEASRRFDAGMAEKLNSLKTPEDLRASLLATVKSGSRRRVITRKVYQYLSMAAGLVLMGYIYTAFIVDRSDDYQGPLLERAYAYSVDGPRLDYFSKKSGEIVSWLTEEGFELPANLPPKLLAQEGIGCRRLNWSEGTVAILCFNAEEVYHLYIANKTEFAEFEAAEEFDYEEREKGWTVSKWEKGDFVYILTAKSSPLNVSSMLANYTP